MSERTFLTLRAYLKFDMNNKLGIGLRYDVKSKNFLLHYLSLIFDGAKSEICARGPRRSGACIRADLDCRVIADSDTAEPLSFILALSSSLVVSSFTWTSQRRLWRRSLRPILESGKARLNAEIRVR